MLSEVAAIPRATERDRLRSLDQLAIIGTPTEERFDQIIRVAKLMFGVPMSSISVIDDKCQWFKSESGLGPTPIPREQTVCQVTIARAYQKPANPILLLEDASENENFASLPGIGGDEGVRFYAGHPLYGPGGHPVGVFCIYDTVPRHLDAKQLDAFGELAMWAQREMQRTEELDRAAEVQRELLPRELLSLPGYEIATLCVPAYSVGGDFFDHYPVKSGACFTVVDVMGKGIGAAILTATVRSALRGISRALDAVPGTDVGTAVNAASSQLADDFDRTASFATAFHSCLDVDSGVIEYVDAGHGLARVRRANGDVEVLPCAGLPLGIGDSWDTGQVTLHPGDMLVVCSDGVLDLLDELSDPGLLTSLVAANATPQSVVRAARSLLEGTLPPDDVTLVAVRMAPGA